MIPKFEANGNLPPGIHEAEWSEFALRFGGTEKRQMLLQGLKGGLLTFDNQRFAQKAKYLGEFFPAWSPAEAGGRTFLDFFQTDRDGNPKGIVAFDLRLRHD
jgi:hypothetical protein